MRARSGEARVQRVEFGGNARGGTLIVRRGVVSICGGQERTMTIGTIKRFDPRR